jgi:hypothetical protein
MKGAAQSIASDPHTPAVSVAIPASMPMGSGVPLAGSGTGFVEVRADGCFYEWQIFNSLPVGLRPSPNLSIMNSCCALS